MLQGTRCRDSFAASRRKPSALPAILSAAHCGGVRPVDALRRGVTAALTSRRKLRRRVVPLCRPAFTRLWPSAGQGARARARQTFRGGFHGRSCNGHRSAAAGGRRGAPSISTHLARMTLGERSLQREVLALFDRQADDAAAAHPPAARRRWRGLGPHPEGSAVGIGAFGWRAPPRRSSRPRRTIGTPRSRPPSRRSPRCSTRPRPRSPACCGCADRRGI